MEYLLLTDVKTYLNITDNLGDVLLNSLISRGCAFMETTLNRKIKQVNCIDEGIGTGESAFFSVNLPIDFTKIEIDGETDVLLDDVLVLAETGEIRLKNRALTENKIYKLYYKGGFVNVPEDIKQVTLDVIAYWYNTRLSKGVQSESDGPVSVTYANVDISKISGLSEIIDNYRIVNV